MRLTSILQQGIQKNGRFQSLALSVYFKHPEFQMDDYEILSRASAFLLSVDPAEPTVADGPYGHLEVAEHRRRIEDFKREHNYTPVSTKGRLMDMGWLEFAPREIRPRVHVVASSHVLAPFLWKDYYPQDWLAHVQKEHCRFTLEVFEKPGEDSLAKIALTADPYHHPEGRDVALAHFQEEAASLRILENLGVHPLHLRSPEKLYRKNEGLVFDGYEVADPNTNELERVPGQSPAQSSSDEPVEEDVRIFLPHRQKGNLMFHTNDRFFAATDTRPLPEGVCGGPVLDADGDCCGVVEGIVPVNHKDERLAGSAAFLPSFVLEAFVDFVERHMLQQIMPPELFQMVVAAKNTNSIGGETLQTGDTNADGKEEDYSAAYEALMQKMKMQYSKEEFQAIMDVVSKEQDQVLEILSKEGGGDLSEILQRVRNRTEQIRDMIHEEFRRQNSQHPTEDGSGPAK